MKRQKDILKNTMISEPSVNPRTEVENGKKPPRRKLWKKLRYGLYLLILLVPLLYLAVQLQSIYFRPYRTQTAVEVTLSDAVPVQGVVVRQEVPVTAAGEGVRGYLLEDGVRVPAGTSVAALYADEYSVRSSEQCKTIEKRIESLYAAQTLKTTSTDLNTLTKGQQTNIYSFLKILEEKDYAQLEDTVLSLTESVNRLQIATGREKDYQELIARLQQQKEALEQASQPIEVCAAPRAGFFVSETDGYEAVLFPHEVLEWKAEQIEQAAQGGIPPQTSSQTVGKVITDYKWYLVCIMEEKEAERFEPLIGTNEKVQLLFHSSAQLEAPAYVQSIEAAGDGKVKVVLRAETMNADVARLRFEKTEVSIRTVTGLRIDKEALRVENGEYGVYVKRGSVAKYRRITPIFENDQYVLVPVTPNEEKTGINEVEMFDEIIVEGKDLYDGKLL